MRKFVASAAAVGLTLLALLALLSTQPRAADEPGDARSQDEQAIRQMSEAFARAFAAGDATKIGQLWTPQGEYLSDDRDEPLHGRDAIAKAYAEFVAKRPKITAEAKVEKVRFLGRDTAVEEGVFTVKSVDGEGPATSSRYSTLYVREEGAWRIALMKEWDEDPAEPTGLDSLAWLVGTWDAGSDDRRVETTYEWAAGKKFLVARFKVSGKGAEAETTGVQVIGVDPAYETIHSWLFESDGGIGESSWSWDGERWEIESNATLADGTESKAVNFVRRAGPDAFTWQSVDRVEEGERQPDIGPVKVTRRAAGRGKGD
jgi:uncharacterized protein (TIGR02246 family)